MSSGGFPCWNFLTAGICVSTPGISFRVRFYRHQAGRKLLLLLRSRFSLTRRPVNCPIYYRTGVRTGMIRYC